MPSHGGQDLGELVVLVDRNDRQWGTAPKLSAHMEGELHRAVSVFVFDVGGSTLLQRRAVGKYHSGGLWSNTCCGHPRPGESPEEAAHRRLWEEMGFDCPLVPALGFVYRRALPNGLVEHEYDHLFVGRFDGVPAPDPREVDDWRWVAPDELLADMTAQPQRYSVWFPLALRQLLGRPAPVRGLRRAG
jgi:isopentenyl-diphosphate delta-isomerase